jgi:hypothetical protein
MATAQILIEREKSNVLNFKDVTEVDAARTTTTRRSTGCCRADRWLGASSRP